MKRPEALCRSAIPQLTTLRRRQVCVLGLSALAGAAVASDEAARLAQQVHERPAGRDVAIASRMELLDKSGSKRVRELVSFRLERGKNDYANLVRFLNPPDIAGVGLLSLDKADGTNEQWLYLPELDRVRRIAGDRKGGRFVGSDLYYEDLQTRQPASDTHRLLGREVVMGVPCELLESTPVDAANSVYRKRVAWVDAATATVMRVDYFERSESTVSKRWTMLARKEVQGYMTVMDSKTVDLATGHETRLRSDAVRYDRKLPARLFTPQALADESLEARYRP